MTDEIAADLALRQEVAERKTYKSALHWIGWLIGALAVFGTVIGYAIAGLPGVWGALIGVALSGLSGASTVWSVSKTIGAASTTFATSVFGTWLVKIVLLIAAMAFLRGRTFFNPYVLFTVLVIGVLGSLAIESLAVHRSKMHYVVPHSRHSAGA